MSRGTEVKEADEACAVYAIGQAINYAAIDLQRVKPDSYPTYESARNAVTEGMTFWLSEEFKKSKYFG